MVAANNGIFNTVGASISGVTNTLTITNPSNTASSAAREKITVGGGSAGDPTLNFNISGVTDWEMGADNSDSDKFKLSQSAALGTTDTFIMTKAGQRTMPLQPAFFSYINGTVANVSGDSSIYTVIFDAILFDQNSNYNTVNGKFTAPVTGKYWFYSQLWLTGLTNVYTISEIQLVKNGALPIYRAKQNTFLNTIPKISGFWSLSAGDTINVLMEVAGGTKTISISNPNIPNGYDSYFQGFLVC